MTETRRVDEREAAAYVGLSVYTLQHYRCYGGGPQFLRLGCAIRYDITDLDVWLASRKHKSTREYTNAKRGGDGR